MNTVRRFGIAALAVGSLYASTLLAADAFVGTWVLNAAKSKLPGGLVPDSVTMVVTDAGAGKYKTVSDTAMAGVTAHSEITFAFDGKEYAPVTTPAQPGMPPVTQVSERVSDSSYTTSVRVGGELIATTLSEVSSDGKSLTMTTKGEGEYASVSSVMVFERK
jgi:hypothetical protein